MGSLDAPRRPPTRWYTRGVMTSSPKANQIRYTHRKCKVICSFSCLGVVCETVQQSRRNQQPPPIPPCDRSPRCFWRARDHRIPITWTQMANCAGLVVWAVWRRKSVKNLKSECRQGVARKVPVIASGLFRALRMHRSDPLRRKAVGST